MAQAIVLSVRKWADDYLIYGVAIELWCTPVTPWYGVWIYSGVAAAFIARRSISSHVRSLRRGGGV